ncbi:MAG: GDP-mannose 4,6-dehydratase [Actinomycetota bacterium]|nr:GDP-mannose 4,6-dehydratase [Actinomycetota bacterium]
MRVLVTGASGFVGHWMLEHLEAAGDEVLGLDESVDITAPEGLMEAVTAFGPEGICHLAAQASVGASWTSPAATFEVNTLGVVHLLEAALACEAPPRVLLVSSAEVYGVVTPDSLPIGEDHPFAPASPYAASKAAAELIGLQYWLGKGLEVVRARPFNHTGAGQRPDFVVPSLARQVTEAARHGLGELAAGNLDVRRDITDVRDVVRAYRALLVEGQPGEAYNVCRGESVTIASVATRLLQLAGLNLPIRVDPARLRPVDLPDLRGDAAKIRAATSWKPEIDLDETLSDVLAYWSDPARQESPSS